MNWERDDYDSGYEAGLTSGVALAFGIIGMATAIAENAPLVNICAGCGYCPERDGEHPDPCYDDTTYRCKANGTIPAGLYCGRCADEHGLSDVDED